MSRAQLLYIQSIKIKSRAAFTGRLSTGLNAHSYSCPCGYWGIVLYSCLSCQCYSKCLYCGAGQQQCNCFTPNSLMHANLLLQGPGESAHNTFYSLVAGHSLAGQLRSTSRVNFSSPVFNGTSILTTIAANDLASLPGVLNVWPVQEVGIPDLQLSQKRGMPAAFPARPHPVPITQYMESLVLINCMQRTSWVRVSLLASSILEYGTIILM